jgi:hypothetical protein
MRQPRVAIFSPLNTLIRQTRKLAALFSSLALFICCAGGVSYAGSAGLKPLNVIVLDTHFYPTLGQAAQALVTADNRYVLVYISCIGATGTPPSCNPSMSEAGIQVFKRPGFTNPCFNDTIISIPQPSGGVPVVSVFGMQFFPPRPLQFFPSRASIGAAVEQDGAEFFHLFDLNSCAIDGIVNVPQPPVESPSDCATTVADGGNCYPGTFDLAVTPNGRPEYAFVANEYGLPSEPGANIVPCTSHPKTGCQQGGTVGIIGLQQDPFGRFKPGIIGPNNNIYIPGANTIPGVTISHDGKHLYVVNEEAADGSPTNTTGLAENPYRDPTNVVNTPNGAILTSQNCQNAGTGSIIVNNGLLTVIDVAAAESGKGQDAIVMKIAAGCAPVRVVETADGKYIWVAARGQNLNLPVPTQQGMYGYQVLAFDVSKLSTSPNDALVGYGDTGGTAPVGMALFDRDQLLAVANSNRFEGKFNPPQGHANVAILDVSNPKAPTVIKRIPNLVNSFPRNVTLGPDGSTLYVPNFNASSLEVIKTFVVN